jgi:hypothetical protein
MKNVFMPLLLSIHLLVAGTSYAQSSTPKYYLNDIHNLDSLSGVYFQKGDFSFLEIDAYKDGLIKLNEDAAFKFEDGVLTLKGKELSEPYKSKYLAKINANYNNLYGEKYSNNMTVRFSLGPGDGKPGEPAFVYEVIDEFAANEQLNTHFNEVKTRMRKDSHHNK